MDNGNPNSSTTGGGGGGGVDGDNMSQASSQSRSSNLNGSLLDRIKAKQAGGSGTGVEQQTQGQMIVEPAAPTQISIPNYNPTMTNNGGGGAGAGTGAGTEAGHNIAASNDFSELGASSMMSGLGFGAAQGGGVEGGISESLLGGEHREGDPNYSMGNYFQTFVMDVYNLFQSIPVWAQVIVLALMIFLVVKLI